MKNIFNLLYYFIIFFWAILWFLAVVFNMFFLWILINLPAIFIIKIDYLYNIWKEIDISYWIIWFLIPWLILFSWFYLLSVFIKTKLWNKILLFYFNYYQYLFLIPFIEKIEKYLENKILKLTNKKWK